MNDWLTAHAGLRMDALLDDPSVFPPARQAFHVARYRFASGIARGLRVADVACGLGYGSRVLLDGGAARVTGVDIDARAVAYAASRYPGSSFIAADAAATTLPDGSVDVVTSFETLEHIADDAAALDEFARILAPGGALVCSVPNSWGLSPYHVRNYDAASLVSLLDRRFNRVSLWNQNSGCETAYNRGQPAGIVRTTGANADRAECLLAVGWRRG